MADSLETLPLFIAGEEWWPNKTFSVTSPSTGKVLHKCGAAGVEEANHAAQAAADALPSWRKTTPQQRRDILFKAAEIMERRREELSQFMADENGSAAPFCAFNLNTSIDIIKDVAGRIATLGGSFPTTNDSKTSAIVLQEPYGVVLSIAPWNAPYILGTRSVVSPLAAGNTVVFKVSESAPKTMLAIASVFHEAGLPKGVLNAIAHEPADAAAVTSALIENPHIKKINFTGSTSVGRIIGKLAGQHLKPVVQELGGKAPVIICEDADVKLAATQCALGSFMYAGQICMATEKILVHKTIKDQFLEAFKGAIEGIFSPKDEALVLINNAAVEKNKKLVEDAVTKGASLIYGDKDAQEYSSNRLRPLVLSGVTPTMDIYKTESFGPTVSVIEFEEDEEAVRIANDTEYGLSSAVFTENLKRGLRIAREIETGAVHINAMTVHDESALPHGGAKSSGYGRFNASHGLSEWVRTKTITFQN